MIQTQTSAQDSKSRHGQVRKWVRKRSCKPRGGDGAGVEQDLGEAQREVGREE